MFENCSLVTSCGWRVKEVLQQLVCHYNLLCSVQSSGQVVKWIRTCVSAKWLYYSTIMSFYHIRSRERAKYEAVIHCCVLV